MTDENDLIPRGAVYWRRRGVLDSGYFVLLDETSNTGPALGIEFHLSMEAFGGLPGYEWETKRLLLYEKGKRIHHNPNKSRRFSDKEISNLNEFMQIAIKNIKEHGPDWAEKEHWENTGYWRD